MAIIVSGFPGVGKSHAFKNSNFKCFDSDSSTFSRDRFPENYISHIKSCLCIPDLDFIFVSTHLEIRKALHIAEIPFYLVYPQISLIDEYLKRYKDRGSSQAFIELLNAYWNDWIRSCSEDKTPCKIRLGSGEYLQDVIKVLAPPSRFKVF